MANKFIKNLEKKILEGISKDELVTDISQLCMMTSGHNEIEILKAVMFIYFKKLQNETEDILKTKDPERAELLIKDIEHFLTLCYMRHRRIKEVKSKHQMNYEDILASLLSVYIDLHSVLSIEDEAKAGRKLCGFVLYVTDECSDCRIAVLLEVCNVAKDCITVFLPTVRRCLEVNQDEMTEEQYLKYILAVKKMSTELGGLTEEQKAARRIPAPVKLIEWLESQKPELCDDLSCVYDMSLTKLTAYLLEEASEEMTKLLQEVVIDLSATKLCEFESQRSIFKATIADSTSDQEVSHSQRESAKEESFPNIDTDLFREDTEQELTVDQEQKDDEPYFFVDKLASDSLKIDDDSMELPVMDDIREESGEEENPVQDIQELPLPERLEETVNEVDTEVFQPFFVDKIGSKFQTNQRKSLSDHEDSENSDLSRKEPKQTRARLKGKRKNTAILPSPEVKESKIGKPKCKKSTGYGLRSRRI